MADFNAVPDISKTVVTSDPEQLHYVLSSLLNSIQELSDQVNHLTEKVDKFNKT